MRFVYRSRLSSLARSWKEVAMALGLTVVPAAVGISQVSGKAAPVPATKPTTRKAVAAADASDPRVVRLSRFFSRLQCPVRSLSADFVSAADENHLDWRLLPSISVVESGGGKVYRNNNIFGWSNGTVLFSSIRRSIHEIAFKLGRSPLYRHEDTLGKLRIYNSDAEYARNVLDVMNRISPTAQSPIRQSF